MLNGRKDLDSRFLDAKFSDLSIKKVVGIKYLASIMVSFCLPLLASVYPKVSHPKSKLAQNQRAMLGNKHKTLPLTNYAESDILIQTITK